MIRDISQTEYYEAVQRVRELNTECRRIAHVKVFGCQQNEADGECVRGILSDMGYTVSDSYADADVIILVTCAIREHAEMKALSMLGNFKQIKRRNPDLIVGVIGCMAAEPTVIDRLKKDFHYVSFTLPPNMLHELPSVIARIRAEGRRCFDLPEDDGGIVEGAPVIRTDPFRAKVPIMFGCNNFCSYCIVPYVRGRERSRSSAAVIAECEQLVKGGCREITLLGQNVNSYKAELSFSQLLRRIAQIDGDFIIRFMTSHPKDASTELISVMKEFSPKIAPFFHLPLQSGSNAILRRMNRTYTKERYLELASALRAAIPDIALSTDVIIGFPGESDADFAETMDVLRTVKFDMVYSFLFSPRDGTVAARMAERVSENDKARRMNELLEYQARVTLERNSVYIGKTVRALVEQYNGSKNELTARTYTGRLVHFKSQTARIGDFVDLKITSTGAFDLFGEQN